jgi:hypothetical protein
MPHDLRSASLTSLVLALALAGCTAAPGARSTSEASNAGGTGVASERSHDVLEPQGLRERLTDWMESPWCGQRGYGPDATWRVYPCPDGAPQLVVACGTAAPRLPLWSRTRDTPEDAWSEWRLRSDWYCPVDLPAGVHAG